MVRRLSLLVLQTSKQSLLGIQLSNMQTIRISSFQQLTTAVDRQSSKTSLSGPGTTISRQIRPNLLRLFSSTTERRKRFTHRRHFLALLVLLPDKSSVSPLRTVVLSLSMFTLLYQFERTDFVCSQSLARPRHG